MLNILGPVPQMNNVVNEKKHIIHTNTAIFAEKNVRSFCSAKAPHNFSAKNNITATDFVSTVTPNKSSTND